LCNRVKGDNYAAINRVEYDLILRELKAKLIDKELHEVKSYHKFIVEKLRMVKINELIYSYTKTKIKDIDDSEIMNYNILLSTSELNELNQLISEVSVSESEYNNLENRARNHVTKLNYITPLNTREYDMSKDTHSMFIAADFETVVVDESHHPFCSSISYMPNRKKHSSDIDCNVVSKSNYIDIQDLNDDGSNISQLSDSLLLDF
jgi:hypothetical protein